MPERTCIFVLSRALKWLIFLAIATGVTASIGGRTNAMDYNNRDVYIGIKAAEIRATRQIEDFDVTELDVQHVRAQVESVLNVQETQLSPRAVQLVSEVLAVSAISRSYYDDEDFDVNTASDVVGNLSKILNSWIHE